MACAKEQRSSRSPYSCSGRRRSPLTRPSSSPAEFQRDTQSPAKCRDTHLLVKCREAHVLAKCREAHLFAKHRMLAAIYDFPEVSWSREALTKKVLHGSPSRRRRPEELLYFFEPSVKTGQHYQRVCSGTNLPAKSDGLIKNAVVATSTSVEPLVSEHHGLTPACHPPMDSSQPSRRAEPVPLLALRKSSRGMDLMERCNVESGGHNSVSQGFTRESRDAHWLSKPTNGRLPRLGVACERTPLAADAPSPFGSSLIAAAPDKIPRVADAFAPSRSVDIQRPSQSAAGQHNANKFTVDTDPPVIDAKEVVAEHVGARDGCDKVTEASPPPALPSRSGHLEQQRAALRATLEELAAIKIQKTVRGCAGRKRVQQLRAEQKMPRVASGKVAEDEELQQR